MGPCRLVCKSMTWISLLAVCIGPSHSPFYFTPGHVSSFDLIFYNSSFYLVYSGLLAVLTLHACTHHKGFPAFSLEMFSPQIARELTPSFFMSLLKYHLLTILYEKAHSPLNARIFLFINFLLTYICGCLCACVCLCLSMQIETVLILSVSLVNFHKVNSAM